MGQMTRNEGPTTPDHFKDAEADTRQTGRKRSKSAFDMHGKFLDGQLLVAMSSVGEPFERAVIYLCAHSEEGAMGIVINRPASKVKFPELLVQLDVIGEHDAIRLPGKVNAMQVLKGGPVETQRGFVLHSNDFFIDNSTLPIDQGIALTATVDILRAIAGGSGPERAVLALGYAGWGAGQLEEEMQDNVWLNVPADPALIFDRELGSKYERAMRDFGIDLAQLVDPGLSRTSYRH